VAFGLFAPLFLDQEGDDPFDPIPKQLLVGSLAGAAHPSKNNVGVQRGAQRGGKPRVEDKAKSLLDSTFQRHGEP